MNLLEALKPIEERLNRDLYIPLANGQMVVVDFGCYIPSDIAKLLEIVKMLSEALARAKAALHDSIYNDIVLDTIEGQRLVAAVIACNDALAEAQRIAEGK